MNTLTADDIRNFLSEKYSDQLAAAGLSGVNIPDDFDLLSEGIIDSLGIIELLAALENKFEIQIDLEDLDPEDLVIVGPFSKYVAGKAIESSNESY